MRINNNVAAFNANRNLSSSNMSLGKSLEKLSSGFRINRAGDDAAGLTISQGLRAQASGLQQATRNAQDGISVVQTAEGALTEVHSMLNRMRDLAVQAANTGTNDAEAVGASQKEFKALSDEITRISESTKFGSKKLLDGSFGEVSSTATSAVNATNSYTIAGTANAINVTLGTETEVENIAVPAGTYNGDELAAAMTTAINDALPSDSKYKGQVSVTNSNLGAGSAFTIEVKGLSGETLEADRDFSIAAGTANSGLAAFGLTAGPSTTATGGGGEFQVGANAGETISVSIGDMDANSLGVAAQNLSTDASAAITALDSAISTVSSLRSDLGATQNRFESTINNLQVSNENIVASESRIRDTDMATEMTNFTKQQILQQAGTAMLGQANSLPQGVLRLLG